MKVIANYKLYLILVTFVALIFLLFFAGGYFKSSRSWQAAWNLGHIPLFLFFGYIVFCLFPAIQPRKLPVQFLLLVLISLVLGTLIELIQSFVGRQASLGDVLLDVVGGIFSVIVFSNRIRILDFYQKAAIVCLVLFVMVFISQPLVLSLWDEYQARDDFPMLANFEHTRELDRWLSIEKMTLSGEVSTSGLQSLKVSLTPRTYSGIEMKYFPSDWSDYEQLVLNVFHPMPSTLSLAVSIYDYRHQYRHFAYTDRFTKRFTLRQGWNKLSISLDDVKQAPRKRVLDMTRISGIRLFVARLKKSQPLYIDELVLEN